MQNSTYSYFRGLRPYRGNRSVRRHGRQAADFAAASAVVWNTAAAGMDAAVSPADDGRGGLAELARSEIAAGGVGRFEAC